MIMNNLAITGTVATVPRHFVHAFVPTTTFDLRVEFARRTYTFQVRAMNDDAKSCRYLHVNDPVAITGYLHIEPTRRPDGQVVERVEIAAYDVEYHPPRPAEEMTQ